ncbi:hypothetical protein CEXT_583651 [Caerostris extrusa]|uniref:Uncharacterized protein n=1 Tax=Caerostris extrusa TaxID=172846 RepID=A0AAV4XN85_CAEEX|nr:hypothetical protein CEXT_583651 [Caerostris extrusa]
MPPTPTIASYPSRSRRHMLNQTKKSCDVNYETSKETAVSPFHQSIPSCSGGDPFYRNFNNMPHYTNLELADLQLMCEIGPEMEKFLISRA